MADVFDRVLWLRDASCAAPKACKLSLLLGLPSRYLISRYVRLTQAMSY
jgi:hypothetical protein